MKKTLLAFTALVAASVSMGQAHAQVAPSDDAAKTQARTIYEQIVNMDTSVEGLQTPQAAEYLAGQFIDAGFAPEDVNIIPETIAQGPTAALVVRYRGDGSGGDPILLLAHMDVVTAHREDWTRDPFTMVEEDGFFFGRGTLDNKAGVTLVTSTLLRWKQNGVVPSRDLIVFFSGDEELGGATVGNVINNHRDLIEAEFALNSDAGGGGITEAGDPTTFNVQTAEKTFASFTWTTHNPGGHSSRPRRDNAIYDLADALDRLRAYEFPVMYNETTLASMEAVAPLESGEIKRALERFVAHPGDRRAAARLSEEPGYIGQVRTTCVPTLLSAGHADNALPQSATATVNCRIFPGVEVEDVQAVLQEIAGPEVEIAPLDEYWAAPASPLRDDVFAAVRVALDAIHPETPISPGMSAGATDGKYFRAIGIPVYGVSGLFIKSSDAYAHGLNERLPVASFYDGLVFWDAMLNELAGPAE